MRVVVGEDSLLTREGIVRLLGDAGYTVVGQGADYPSVMRAVELESPDLVVVDIRMPPTHTDEGLVAARDIREHHPDIGVLVLSQYIEPTYALRLLEEHPGGVGYLLKEKVFDVAVLVDALRRIADDETVVDPSIVSRLFGGTAVRTPWTGSVNVSGKCSGSLHRDCPTLRSRVACSSPNEPFRPTPRRSSSSSGCSPTPTPTAGCSPS